MKKFELEIDLRLCQEVPPTEGDSGGGTGSSGSGDDQGAGNEGTTPGEGGNNGDGGGAAGNGDLVIKPLDPDPLWPPIGI